VDVREVGDLAEGVRAGFEWARPDGVVLLSPAAPSFGRYVDYRDRAAAFVQAMEGLAGPPEA
jgi:UDP-N-acetylmuramoylalanine--D-glutamate ligase